MARGPRSARVRRRRGAGSGRHAVPDPRGSAGERRPVRAAPHPATTRTPHHAGPPASPRRLWPPRDPDPRGCAGERRPVRAALHPAATRTRSPRVRQRRRAGSGRHAVPDPRGCADERQAMRAAPLPAATRTPYPAGPPASWRRLWPPRGPRSARMRRRTAAGEGGATPSRHAVPAARGCASVAALSPPRRGPAARPRGTSRSMAVLASGCAGRGAWRAVTFVPPAPESDHSRRHRLRCRPNRSPCGPRAG